MKKKLPAIIVILAMCMSLSPTAVFAESGIATYSTTLSTITDEDGKTYYQIFDEDDLYAFAEMENNTKGSTLTYNAVLEADITVNSGVLKADGSLNTDESSTFKAWTPIGRGGTSPEQTAYGGTFDGKGHTISGLYYNAGGSSVGFFGAINRFAHIKNLGIVDSYFESGTDVGGLVGSTFYDENDAPVIEDCFSTATVKGESVVGVFCGNAGRTTIRNSYAAGKYSGTSLSNAFYGVTSKAEDGHCYALEPDTSKQKLDWGVNYCGISAFTSGEVAYGLDYGRGIWGQKIGTDSLPKRGGEKVYYSSGTYHNHDSSNNYCVYCGAMAANSNDIYEIKTMDNLYWFANLVNTGTTSAKAILKNDITVTGSWTAIGNNSAFTGSFDGANHKVSINGGSLFASIGSDGTVTKLGVSGGSLCSGTNGGSINGCYVSDSTAAVKLCNVNTGTITSSYAAGGSGTVICGSGSGTVTNCCTLAGSTAKAADGADFTTSAPFSSGEATYRLNGSKSDGSLIWGQTIGMDTMPAFGGKAVYLKDGNYHNHNGYCTICSFAPEYDAANGGWQIGTEDELYWFAKFVNGELTIDDGNTYTQDAVLTADIRVNEKVLDEDGKLIENWETLTKWTPIGIVDAPNDIDKPFTGTFDGKNHTISGLCCYAVQDDHVGLFGENDGTIKNVKIYDSFFQGNDEVGVICGVNAEVTESPGTIENCHTEFTLSTGAMSVGGICGYNVSVIKSCSNAGWVGRYDKDGGNGNKKIEYLGGICGVNFGALNECINTGYVGTDEGDMNHAGGIVGRNDAAYFVNIYLSTVENCINAGTVAGSNNVGGICGQNCADIYYMGVGMITPYNFGGLIWNCFSIGTVSGKTNTGGICGENAAEFYVPDKIKEESTYYENYLYGGRIFDCAYEKGKVTVDGTQTDIAVGKNSRDDDRKEAVISEVFAVTAAELASGETAYQLCEKKSGQKLLFGDKGWYILDNDTFKWKQNIDTGIADAYPKFTGAEVYKTAEASECKGYTNNTYGMREHSEGTDHKCKWCGEMLTIPVTVSGITATDKTYDGTAAATLNFDAVTISGAESGAKLSVNAVGTFDNANAGENKTVTITEITLTGEDADKYSLAETGQQTETKANITAKSLASADVTVSNSFTYSGNPQSPNAGDLTVKLDGRTLNAGSEYTVSADAKTNAAAGYTLTVEGTGNYSGIVDNVTWSILPLQIALKEVKIKNKQYDGTKKAQIEAVKFICSSNSGEAGFVDYALAESSYSAAAEFEDKNVGKKKIVTVTVTLNDSNHSFANGQSKATMNVEAEIEALTAVSPSFGAKVITYTGQSVSHEISGTFTGISDIKYSYEGKGETVYAKSDNAPKNTGTYTVTASFTMDEGYAQLSPITATLTINKAELIIKAKDNAVTYGQGPVANGVTYSGFVNGETESVLNGSLEYDFDYTRYGNVGTYSITPKGVSAANYEISFEKGALTVNRREVGLDWSNETLTYSGIEQVPNVTVTGLVNEDVCTASISGKQKNAGTGYTATVTALSNSNYSLPAEESKLSKTFEIEKAEITFVISAEDKTYDGNREAVVSEVIDGLMSGERLTRNVDYTVTAVFEDANASTSPKGVTAEIALLQTGKTENYKLKEGRVYATALINKADAQISGTAEYTKNYGDSAFALDAASNHSEAKLTYVVSGSKDSSGAAVENDKVVTVDENGNVTVKGAGSATVTISQAASTNYNAAQDKQVEITVNRHGDAPNMPELTMKAAARCKTVGALELPEGWAWNSEDSTKELKTGETVSARAEYIGEGSGSYAVESVTVEITRAYSGGAPLLPQTPSTGADEPSDSSGAAGGNEQIPSTGADDTQQPGDAAGESGQPGQSADIEQTAAIKTIKEKVSAMTIIARSNKTANGNIKITLRMNSETESQVKAIEDMGYSVKYKFYRSTKKSAKYSAKVTKTSKTYVNTFGTKGTMYYYKARIQVYDKAGKLVAQSELKQCRYANRAWTRKL